MGTVSKFPTPHPRHHPMTQFLSAAPRTDDTSPLTIMVVGKIAAQIRRDALWFGKSPEQFAADWLSGYIPRESE